MSGSTGAWAQEGRRHHTRADAQHERKAHVAPAWGETAGEALGHNVGAHHGSAGVGRGCTRHGRRGHLKKKCPAALHHKSGNYSGRCARLDQGLVEHDHSPGYTQFRYLMLALYFIFAPVVTSLTMSLELYVNTRYLFEKSPEPYVATFERLRRFNAIIFDGILQSMIQIQVLSTNHKHAETRTMIASLFISTLNLLWNSYNLWNNIRLDYRPAPYYVRDLFKAGLTGIHGLDDVQAGVKDLLYEGREHIEHQFDVITIAKQLGDLPQEVVKVRRLRLRRCDVDDRGASALCIMLSRNRSLKRPNLEHGIITSKGATQLANSLLRNTVLNHLHLHENLIEDPGLTHLSAILRDPRCAPITTFEISSNKYSTPGIKALAKTLQVRGPAVVFTGSRCGVSAPPLAIPPAPHPSSRGVLEFHVSPPDPAHGLLAPVALLWGAEARACGPQDSRCGSHRSRTRS